MVMQCIIQAKRALLDFQPNKHSLLYHQKSPSDKSIISDSRLQNKYFCKDKACDAGEREFDMKKEKQNTTLPKVTKDIPVLNIRMMTDDEWNRLAYRNRLEREAKARG